MDLVQISVTVKFDDAIPTSVVDRPSIDLNAMARTADLVGCNASPAAIFIANKVLSRFLVHVKVVQVVAWSRRRLSSFQQLVCTVLSARTVVGKLKHGPDKRTDASGPVYLHTWCFNRAWVERRGMRVAAEEPQGVAKKSDDSHDVISYI